MPVSKSNPLVGEPDKFIDDPVVFRVFYCPGCGSQIDNEIALENDPILHDMEITVM